MLYTYIRLSPKNGLKSGRVFEKIPLKTLKIAKSLPPDNKKR
jgi:hypothetical protein